ncbi:MAG: biopolymer transporter ExbD, partial [Bacteroidales bacterium]
TMDHEKGIARRLPPMPNKDQKAEDMKVNRRNILEVKISSGDRIFAGGEYLSDASQLDEIVINFFTNPNNSDKLPSFKTKNIEGFGECRVSEGVISLQNDRATHYDIYLRVQNALVRAINTLRDNFAMQNWGKKYEDLDDAHQKIVRKAVPQSISESEPVNVGKK